MNVWSIMNLREILREKGSDVFCIEPTATLQEAIQLLIEKNCGSLVVTHDGRMQGIITERDILLRNAATYRELMLKRLVRDCMTPEPITGTPADDLSDTMGVMTNYRIRHLPIVEDDRIVGIVSIGDIVKAQHHQLTVENYYLKNYIQG
jgi:CBS domain-containing protein